MQEFVFEVVIATIVRLRAETKALARQAVISSALASPSEDEIRLAYQAGFVRARKPRSPALIFRSMKTSSSSGISTSGLKAFLPVYRKWRDGLSVTAATIPGTALSDWLAGSPLSRAGSRRWGRP